MKQVLLLICALVFLMLLPSFYKLKPELNDLTSFRNQQKTSSPETYTGTNSCFERNADPRGPFKTYARLLYVDKELETPYSISGNDYEKAFIDQYKEIFITDSIRANGLKTLVTHSRPANHPCELDTRIKLYLYKSRTDSSVIIVDGFDDICLDGTPIKENKLLIKFINNLIPH